MFPAVNERPYTCVVAEDHPSVLRTLTELLQAWGWTILATSSEGEEALVDQGADVFELCALVALHFGGGGEESQWPRGSS